MSESLPSFIPPERAWHTPLFLVGVVADHVDGTARAGSLVLLIQASQKSLVLYHHPDADGHQLWTYHSSDGQPMATTFFAENGICYLIQHDATVVGIRVSDGQVLWRTQIAALKNQNLQTIGFFSLDQGNLVLSFTSSETAVYILRASDGHLLWRSPETISSPITLNGTLYAWQNNGQLDAWRESDGQHLWGYSAPIGSSMVGHLPQGSPLLFLLDPIGTFYILRASSGKLLWRYPWCPFWNARGETCPILWVGVASQKIT